MAEMYVYKGSHWMDALTQEQIDVFVAKNKHFMDRYNARWRPGDVVQVMKDGEFWDTEKNDWRFENHNPKLMFVKLDSINYEDAMAKYPKSYKAISSHEEVCTATREKYNKDIRLLGHFAEDPIIVREFTEYDEKLGQDVPMVELRGRIWNMKARRKIRLKIETASPQELTDMENMRVVLTSITEEDKGE